MSRKYSWSFATIVLTVFILFFIFNSEYFVPKPTVDTAAANVKASNVTLKGVLKDGENISQYGFRWGNSRSLNERVNLGRAIEADTDFSTTLNGLKAGHTYFYQAYALNSKGYGLGDIKSFTVPERINSAPALSIINPADRLSVARGTTVKISANARDDQKVEAMSFYIDDVVISKVNGAVLNYDWDTSSVNSGEHRLKVTAWDGSKTGGETRLVIVEDNKPVVAADNKQFNNSYNNSNNNNNSYNNITVSRGQTNTDINKYPKLSKVNGVFGQFRYRELSGGRIEADPNWVAENIVTITLPGLNRKVQVHKEAADNFIMAFNYIKNGTAVVNGKQVSLLSLIKTMDGTYVTRHVNWNASRGLSNHSWGTAIDINASDHFCYVDSALDPNMILWEKAFKPAGFSWGNRYSDSMHYELIK